MKRHTVLLGVVLGNAGIGVLACDSHSNRVTGRMQMRPGGPTELVTVEIHESPVDPPSILAAEAELAADELVLGVVVDERPMAYPIRYLALTEVLDDRVGSNPIAPSW
jgi:hypothetical protein